jgi:hypothetical protein
MSTKKNDLSPLIEALLNDQSIKSAAGEIREIEKSATEQKVFQCTDPLTGKMIEQFGYVLLMEDMQLTKKDFIEIYQVSPFEYKRLKRKLPRHIDECEYCKKVSVYAEELNQSVIEIFESFVEGRTADPIRKQRINYKFCTKAVASILISLFLLSVVILGYDRLFGLNEMGRTIISALTSPFVAGKESTESHVEVGMEHSLEAPKENKQTPALQTIASTPPDPPTNSHSQNHTSGNVLKEKDLGPKPAAANNAIEKANQLPSIGAGQTEQPVLRASGEQPSQVQMQNSTSWYILERSTDCNTNPEAQFKEGLTYGPFDKYQTKHRLGSINQNCFKEINKVQLINPVVLGNKEKRPLDSSSSGAEAPTSDTPGSCQDIGQEESQSDNRDQVKNDEVKSNLDAILNDWEIRLEIREATRYEKHNFK